MDTHAIGMAMVSIGAGRRIATDKVDHGLGLTRVVAIGEYLEAGAPLAIAHMRSQEQFQAVNTAFQQGLVLSQQQPKSSPLIYQIIAADGVAV
jgi:thymidine phosphorylase